MDPIGVEVLQFEVADDDVDEADEQSDDEPDADGAEVAYWRGGDTTRWG